MARGLKFNARLVTRDAYRALYRLRNLGEDPRPVLEEWGGILEASTRERFDSGRGPGGVPWLPSKRVQKHGGKTLVDKGNLERAVRYEVRNRNLLLVGVDGRATSVKEAASHQFGVNRTVVVVKHERVIDHAFGVPLKEVAIVQVRGHARRMNLPARPFLGVDNNDRRAMTDSAVSYLRELLLR